MSTAVLPLNGSAPQVQAPASAPQSNDINYLKRNIEFIDPNNAKWTNFIGYTYYAASVVTVVAFLALGAIAVIFTGIFSIGAIPFTTLAIGVLSVPTLKVFNWMQRKAADEFALAERSEKTKEIHDQLPADRAGLQAKLAEIGITPDMITGSSIRADITQLRPLLANYLYWSRASDSAQSEASKLTQEAQKHQVDYPAETDVIDKKRLDSVAEAEKALIIKTNAAFNYGLLLNPTFPRELEDVIALAGSVYSQDEVSKKVVLGERALAARFNDPKAQEFLTVKRTNSPVTFDQARDLGIPELSRRIFA